MHAQQYLMFVTEPIEKALFVNGTRIASHGQWCG